MEEAVSERHKTGVGAHRSDEDRQAYISASRQASPVIAKAKAEGWQATCLSFPPKSVYFPSFCRWLFFFIFLLP